MSQPTAKSSLLSAPSSAAAEHALTLLGPSSAMTQLWSQMRRLAPHLRTLLLVATPDSGQDAVARLLFDLGPGQRRLFVEYSAAEAENRLVRLAGQMTLPPDTFLYLPEVERLSSTTQESLLRILRLRRSHHLTVVAAATSDLRSAVSQGRFHPELAEQLRAVCLNVPSLAERREDIPLLISQLLAGREPSDRGNTPQVTEGFLHAAMRYEWPGNLRQLRRTLEALRMAAAPGASLEERDLHQALAAQVKPTAAEAKPARLVPLDTVVQEHICAVLGACRGNKLRAAEVLGISRSTLYRMLDASAERIDGLSLAS